MKRYGSYGLVLAFVALFTLGGGPGMAQTAESTPAKPAQAGAKAHGAQQELPRAQGVKALLKSLDLKPAELDRIEAVLAKDEGALARDRADIKVLQAQITRLLVDKDPSTDALGKAVKQSLDLEYQIRMIQIGRQLEVRKILGDERWASLLRFSRLAVDAQRAGRLRESFSTRGLSAEDGEIWKRILAYSRRILP